MALLFSAFSHDPLAAEPLSKAVADAQYAAEFVLPDGTVPERCTDFHHDHSEHRAGGCESCRIASFSWLPETGLVDAFVYLRAAEASWPPVEPDHFVRAGYRVNAPSRAPPAFTV